MTVAWQGEPTGQMLGATRGGPLRIAFVIRSLERGGAERHVATLAPALAARGHTVLVLALRAGGVFGDPIESAGVPVRHLAPRGLWLLIGPVRAMGALRRFRPDVVHGVLPHGNLTAALAAPVAGRPRVVFGVRGIRPSRPGRWWNRPFYRLEARLARRAHAVIANSSAAARWAADRGMPSARIAVVANGVDTDRFRPDPRARDRLRAAWGVSPGETLVGRVGTLRTVKGNDMFLEAVAGLIRSREGIRAVLAGEGPERSRLEALAERRGVGGHIVWAGAVDDVPGVMNALDVHVSSSRAESFPTVVAEAMACGTPCVVTDVGDGASIVGTTGVVVPPGDPRALRAGIETLLERLRDEAADLRTAARSRIVERFGAVAMATRTEEVLTASEPASRPE